MPLLYTGSTANTHNALLIFYPLLLSMEHDIPPGGSINVPPGDNQVTKGNPVAPKVYFQAPGMTRDKIWFVSCAVPTPCTSHTMPRRATHLAVKPRRPSAVPPQRLSLERTPALPALGFGGSVVRWYLETKYFSPWELPGSFFLLPKFTTQESLLLCIVGFCHMQKVNRKAWHKTPSFTQYYR